MKELVEITISYTNELKKCLFKAPALSGRTSGKNSICDSRRISHIDHMLTIYSSNDLSSIMTNDSFTRTVKPDENTTKPELPKTSEVQQMERKKYEPKQQLHLRQLRNCTNLTPSNDEITVDSFEQSETSLMAITACAVGDANAKLGFPISKNKVKKAFKNSFKFMRVALSIFLFIVSIVLFLLTIFKDRDFFQQVFSYFIDSIEISAEHGRPL